MSQIEGSMPGGEQDALVGMLRAALAADVKVEALRRLKGGFSREIWAFDAIASGQLHELVLCKDGSGGAVQKGDESLSRIEEAALLRTLHSRGIAVPAILCAGDERDGLGGDYLVMTRVAGESDVAPLLKNPIYLGKEMEFTAQIATVLAEIQRCPIPQELAAKHSAIGGPLARRELDRWQRACATIPDAMTPVIDAALRRLDSDVPTDLARVVVVHGDFRVGNFIYGPEGLRAVLDWEMAHVGDPLEDVAWAQLVTWTGRVGALVDSAQWLAFYADAAGSHVDRDRLAFWDILSMVKMSCLARRASLHARDVNEKRFLDHLVGMLAAELQKRL